MQTTTVTVDWETLVKAGINQHPAFKVENGKVTLHFQIQKDESQKTIITLAGDNTPIGQEIETLKEPC